MKAILCILLASDSTKFSLSFELMQVKCPKCATVLKLASPPPSGKVKCPKCAAVLNVGAGRPPATRQPATRQPATPAAPSPASIPQAAVNQPTAPTRAPATDGEIDFANLPGSAEIPVRAYQQLGDLTAHIP